MNADSRGSTLTLIGLGAVLGYAIYQYGGVVEPHWQYSLLAIGLISAVYWTFEHNADSFRVWWPALLFPGYTLIQFLTISVKPAATFDHFLRILGYTIVFLTIQRIAQQKPWAPIIPLIAVTTLEASLGLIRYFFGDDSTAGAHGTYVNRNHFAGLLEMALPFAIIAATRMRIIWVSVGLIFTAIICSYSRGGFLATLFSLLLMALLLLGKKWSGKQKWLAMTALIISAFFIFIYLPPDSLFNRFAYASKEQIDTLGGRMTYLKNAPPMINKYASFGCGLGGFESAFYAVRYIFPSLQVDLLHNDIVQGFIELGVVGYAIVVFLFLSAINAAIRTKQRLIGIACLGALAAILLHSLVDFNLYIPANALVLAWVCGVSQRTSVLIGIS
jgi:hypothetical protein